MSDLEKRAVKLSTAFFSNMGYEVLNVLDGNKVVKIVARDNESDQIAFISVQVRESVFDSDPAEPQRADYEAEACEWLADHDVPDGACRFDAVMLTVVGDGKAFLRHHVNCMGEV